MGKPELAGQPSAKKGVLDPIIALLRWIWDRLERTLLLALKIVFPSRFISPLGFLGMLTVIVFLILGITGALLLFHFQPIFGDCPPPTPGTTYVPAPTCNSAFNSVSSINNQVNWGFLIRNIHYQASNAMVLLAVMHMFYQYFAGRYKLRYEILWVTGIILGVVPIIEEYTGYDLIFNIRGQLAINIGQTLTYYTPVLGANLAQIIFGFSFNDLTIRFYAFHVFIIPIIMLAIMSVHLPKIFVLIFTLVPFFDRGRKIAMIDRPFWVALGVASLGQIAIVTVWGFRASNPFQPLLSEEQLLIDPALFAGSLLIATALAYGFVYAFVRWRRAKLDALRVAKKPIPYRKVNPYFLSKGEDYALLGGLLLLQAFLDVAIFRAFLDTLNDFALLEIGMVLVAFAATVHIYRVSVQVKY